MSSRPGSPVSGRAGLRSTAPGRFDRRGVGDDQAVGSAPAASAVRWIVPGLIRSLVSGALLDLVVGQRLLLDPVAGDRVLLDLLAVDLARGPGGAPGQDQEQGKGGDDVLVAEPRSPSQLRSPRFAAGRSSRLDAQSGVAEDLGADELRAGLGEEVGRRSSSSGNLDVEPGVVFTGEDLQGTLSGPR